MHKRVKFALELCSRPDKSSGCGCGWMWMDEDVDVDVAVDVGSSWGSLCAQRQQLFPLI